MLGELLGKNRISAEVNCFVVTLTKDQFFSSSRFAFDLVAFSVDDIIHFKRFRNQAVQPIENNEEEESKRSAFKEQKKNLDHAMQAMFQGAYTTQELERKQRKYQKFQNTFKRRP